MTDVIKRTHPNSYFIELPSGDTKVELLMGKTPYYKGREVEVQQIMNMERGYYIFELVEVL